MKKATLLFFIVICSFVLMSCSTRKSIVSPTEESSVPTVSIGNPELTPMPTSIADSFQPTGAPEIQVQEKDWLALYESVFENYLAIAYEDPRQDGIDSSLDPYDLLSSLDFTLWAKVSYGYCLHDLDNNGVPELIIGNMEKNNTIADNVVFSLFTLVDEFPQKVFNSRTWNRYYLSSADSFLQDSTGGAMWADCYVCTYSGTSIVPVYGCYADDREEYGYYRVSNGGRYTGESKQISDYFDYLAILKATILPLEHLTPFSMPNYPLPSLNPINDPQPEVPQEPQPMKTEPLWDQEWLLAYESVFENYRAIADADPRQDTFCYSVDTYNLLDSFDLSIWSNVSYGFFLQDLDNNGIPELFIGNMEKEEFSSDIIFAMFTLVDGQPQKLFSSRTRESYTLSSEGDLFYYGSGGAAWSDYYICSYKDGMISTLYGVFTSNEGSFFVSNGDRYNGEVVQIISEDYTQYTEALRASIIPLPALTPILPPTSTGVLEEPYLINPEEMEEGDWLILYESVFENYRQLIENDPNDYYKNEDMYGLFSIARYSGWIDIEYGFVLRDLDNNGIPELIVGNMKKVGSARDNAISSMFTLVDGHPVIVISTLFGSMCYLSNTGGLFRGGGNQGMWSGHYICDYSGTEVTALYGGQTEGPEASNCEYYRVSKGTRETGDSVQITKEEFREYQLSLEATILPLYELTPIPMD